MESLKKKKRLLDCDWTRTAGIHVNSVSGSPPNTGGRLQKQTDKNPPQPKQTNQNVKTPQSQATHGGGKRSVSPPHPGMTFAEDQETKRNKEHFDWFYMMVKGFDHQAVHSRTFIPTTKDTEATAVCTWLLCLRQRQQCVCSSLGLAPPSDSLLKSCPLISGKTSIKQFLCRLPFLTAVLA